ncbi:hypothetical protein NE237_020889 [Protea cynaroides]|uniref:Uncharacterized protein n=1 Tax=Protea cynaroides TaxID=273540 RepID=A0A9Q0K234_9MAGN|nr:hypothetical protein NE237_020889 [Protea cynaroides]
MKKKKKKKKKNRSSSTATVLLQRVSDPLRQPGSGSRGFKVMRTQEAQEISGTASIMSMEVAMAEGSSMIEVSYGRIDRDLPVRGISALTTGDSETADGVLQSGIDSARACRRSLRKATHAWAAIFGGFLLTQGAGSTREVTSKFGGSSSIVGQDLLSLV